MRYPSTYLYIDGNAQSQMCDCIRGYMPEEGKELCLKKKL